MITDDNTGMRVNLADYAAPFSSSIDALHAAVHHGWTLHTHDNVQTNTLGRENVSLAYALDVAAADPSFVYLTR